MEADIWRLDLKLVWNRFFMEESLLFSAPFILCASHKDTLSAYNS